MDLNITTSQLDASVAVKAHKLYKTGKYAEAIPVLLDILDIEPLNWHARLFLAVSYFKTGQVAAAQRAFRFVYEKCTDTELKQKACLALQSVNGQLQSTKQIPAEFGSLAERMPYKDQPLRLESIIDA